MHKGAVFHQLVHQLILGIPEERLATFAESEDFSGWWTSFIKHIPYDEKVRLFPERVLTTVIGDHHLKAKFDLVVGQENENFIVFDWKTSRKRPKREYMVTRLQSRVYPYVLTKAGKNLNAGQDISPEQIKMVYWYPNFPDDPEEIQYSAVLFKEDGEYLGGLIKEVVSLKEIDQFPLTINENHCRYCVYRSLCDRGETAGDFNNMDDLLEVDDLDIDFDQIAEIEF